MDNVQNYDSYISSDSLLLGTTNCMKSAYILSLLPLMLSSCKILFRDLIFKLIYIFSVKYQSQDSNS
jgi:hypothetical protein